MNIPIKTNQLHITLDTNTFDDMFAVFKIETSEKYFNRGASILDVPLLCNNVRAVYFNSGKCFYVLMSQSESNKATLKKCCLKLRMAIKSPLLQHQQKN